MCPHEGLRAHPEVPSSPHEGIEVLPVKVVRNIKFAQRIETAMTVVLPEMPPLADHVPSVVDGYNDLLSRVEVALEQTGNTEVDPKHALLIAQIGVEAFAPSDLSKSYCGGRNVSYTIARLIEHGLMQRGARKGHRRGVLVSLTRRGYSLCRAIRLTLNGQPLPNGYRHRPEPSMADRH